MFFNLRSSQKPPFHPGLHTQDPLTHCPCWLQSGTWQSPNGISHSAPFQPSSQWHIPPPYCPWDEHSTGHTLLLQSAPWKFLSVLLLSFILSLSLSLLFHKYDRRATLATPFRDLIASINVQVILSEPLRENSIDGRNWIVSDSIIQLCARFMVPDFRDFGSNKCYSLKLLSVDITIWRS